MPYVARPSELDINAIRTASRVTVDARLHESRLTLRADPALHTRSPRPWSTALGGHHDDLVLKPLTPRWWKWRRVARNLKPGDGIGINWTWNGKSNVEFVRKFLRTAAGLAV